MSRKICRDLEDQFTRACCMIRQSIATFDAKQWLNGLSDTIIPAKICYHLIESLDFYSCGKVGKEFPWGSKFGGYWTELGRESLPNQADMTAYLAEVEGRIQHILAQLDDEALAEPFTLYDWSGQTIAGHYTYALRHIMHHHGALTALQEYHGITDEVWC